MFIVILNGLGMCLYVKGVFEIVVKLCMKMMGVDGKVLFFITFMFKEVEAVIEVFAC